jgi:outer membrane protein assembly factor BamB
MQVLLLPSAWLDLMMAVIMRRPFCVALLVFTSASVTAGADTWHGFRGDGSGITTSNLPERWSPTAGIAWKSAIPGYGQSAPVVWQDRVFVTSSDGPFQQSCQVHAFRLTDGDKLWTREIKGTQPLENYFRNSRAAPTCAVDAEGVYSLFASGDVTAITHQGDILWSLPLTTRFGQIDNERGLASSLAQTEQRLFAVVDHHGPSYLIAIDKRTGDVAWKTDRGTRMPSWSSPVIARQDDDQLVIISSSDTVDAYLAATGELLWQIKGLQGNHIPSASVRGDKVFVGSTSMYGVSTDPDEVTKSNCCIQLTREEGKPGYKILWGAERANSYYGTPLAFQGYVYYINKSGVLYCIDEHTGEQHFAKRLSNPCWASAIGAGKGEHARVYFVLKNGTAVVIRPGDQYDQVAMNRIWSREEMLAAIESAAAQRKANAIPPDQAKPKTGPEKVFAGMSENQLHQMFSYGDPLVYGVAAVDGCLLIRTGQHLYCVR